MFPTGLVIKAAIVGAALLAVYLAYSWFTGVLEENKTLTVRAERAEAHVVEERKSHMLTKADYANWREEAAIQMEAEQVSRDMLQTKYDEAREKSNELSEKLAKHDLEYLASRKPGLIERRVNRATDRVFNNLNKLTGDFKSRGGKAVTTP